MKIDRPVHDHVIMQNTSPGVKVTAGEAFMLRWDLTVPFEKLGSLSMQRFWATKGKWKCAVFVFNLPSHYHLISLFSLIDTISLQIWERPLSWRWKYTRWPSVAQKRCILKLSSAVHNATLTNKWLPSAMQMFFPFLESLVSTKFRSTEFLLFWTFHRY